MLTADAKYQLQYHTHVSLKKQNITGEDVPEIICLIGANSALSSLNLDNNQIFSNIDQLINALISHPTITSVSLTENINIADNSIKMGVTADQIDLLNKKLRSKNEKLIEKYYQTLQNLLAKDSLSDQEIELANDNYSKMYELIHQTNEEILEPSNKLKHHFLLLQEFSRKIAKFMGRGLDIFPYYNLTKDIEEQLQYQMEVNLEGHHLTGKFVPKIIEAMAVNRKLKKLNLRNNHIYTNIDRLIDGIAAHENLENVLIDGNIIPATPDSYEKGITFNEIEKINKILRLKREVKTVYHEIETILQKNKLTILDLKDIKNKLKAMDVKERRLSYFRTLIYAKFKDKLAAQNRTDLNLEQNVNITPSSSSPEPSEKYPRVRFFRSDKHLKYTLLLVESSNEILKEYNNIIIQPNEEKAKIKQIIETALTNNTDIKLNLSTSLPNKDNSTNLSSLFLETIKIALDIKRKTLQITIYESEFDISRLEELFDDVFYADFNVELYIFKTKLKNSNNHTTALKKLTVLTISQSDLTSSCIQYFNSLVKNNKNCLLSLKLSNINENFNTDEKLLPADEDEAFILDNLEALELDDVLVDSDALFFSTEKLKSLTIRNLELDHTVLLWLFQSLNKAVELSQLTLDLPGIRITKALQSSESPNEEEMLLNILQKLPKLNKVTLQRMIIEEADVSTVINYINNLLSLNTNENNHTTLSFIEIIDCDITSKNWQRILTHIDSSKFIITRKNTYELEDDNILLNTQRLARKYRIYKIQAIDFLNKTKAKILDLLSSSSAQLTQEDQEIFSEYPDYSTALTQARSLLTQNEIDLDYIIVYEAAFSLAAAAYKINRQQKLESLVDKCHKYLILFSIDKIKDTYNIDFIFRYVDILNKSLKIRPHTLEQHCYVQYLNLATSTSLSLKFSERIKLVEAVPYQYVSTTGVPFGNSIETALNHIFASYITIGSTYSPYQSAVVNTQYNTSLNYAVETVGLKYIISFDQKIANNFRDVFTNWLRRIPYLPNDYFIKRARLIDDLIQAETTFELKSIIEKKENKELINELIQQNQEITRKIGATNQLTISIADLYKDTKFYNNINDLILQKMALSQYQIKYLASLIPHLKLKKLVFKDVHFNDEIEPIINGIYTSSELEQVTLINTNLPANILANIQKTVEYKQILISLVKNAIINIELAKTLKLEKKIHTIQTAQTNRSITITRAKLIAEMRKLLCLQQLNPNSFDHYMALKKEFPFLTSLQSEFNKLPSPPVEEHSGSFLNYFKISDESPNQLNFFIIESDNENNSFQTIDCLDLSDVDPQLLQADGPAFNGLKTLILGDISIAEIKLPQDFLSFIKEQSAWSQLLTDLTNKNVNRSPTKINCLNLSELDIALFNPDLKIYKILKNFILNDRHITQVITPKELFSTAPGNTQNAWKEIIVRLETKKEKTEFQNVLECLDLTNVDPRFLDPTCTAFRNFILNDLHITEIRLPDVLEKSSPDNNNYASWQEIKEKLKIKRSIINYIRELINIIYSNFQNKSPYNKAKIFSLITQITPLQKQNLEFHYYLKDFYSSYDDILKQVELHDFDKELKLSSNMKSMSEGAFLQQILEQYEEVLKTCSSQNPQRSSATEHRIQEQKISTGSLSKIQDEYGLAYSLVSEKIVENKEIPAFRKFFMRVSAQYLRFLQRDGFNKTSVTSRTEVLSIDRHDYKKVAEKNLSTSIAVMIKINEISNQYHELAEQNEFNIENISENLFVWIESMFNSGHLELELDKFPKIIDLFKTDFNRSLIMLTRAFQSSVTRNDKIGDSVKNKVGSLKSPYEISKYLESIKNKNPEALNLYRSFNSILDALNSVHPKTSFLYKILSKLQTILTLEQNEDYMQIKLSALSFLSNPDDPYRISDQYKLAFHLASAAFNCSKRSEIRPLLYEAGFAYIHSQLDACFGHYRAHQGTQKKPNISLTVQNLQTGFSTALQVWQTMQGLKSAYDDRSIELNGKATDVEKRLNALQDLIAKRIESMALSSTLDLSVADSFSLCNLIKPDGKYLLDDIYEDLLVKICQRAIKKNLEKANPDLSKGNIPNVLVSLEKARTVSDISSVIDLLEKNNVKIQDQRTILREIRAKIKEIIPEPKSGLTSWFFGTS